MSALVAVFRSPGLRRLELAWLMTSVGVWGSALVLAVYAYDRGGPSAVGLMGLLRTLPGGPAAPLLTYWADRVSRRSVLLASNVVRGLVLAAIAVCAAADAPLPAVYALVVVFAAASPAYKPSQAALLPLLARTPSELSSANVAVTMLTNAGFVAGSLAGGLLLTALSFPAVAAGLAAAFGLSLVPLLRVPRDTPPEPDPDARPLGELTEGVATIRRDPQLVLLVGLGGLLMLALGAVDVLVVVAALGFLDVGETGAGYLNALMGLGAVAGGFGVLALLDRGRLTAGVSVGAVILGLAGLALGAGGSLAVALPAFVALGAGDAFADAGVGTLLQRLVPDHVLSRVFGLVEAVAVAAMAVGALAAGVLADAVGARAAFIVVTALVPLGVLLCRARLAADEAGTPVPVRAYGLLRGHTIFAPLPVATTERLARGLEELRPRAGARVIEQGMAGDRFFLVAEGGLDVFIDGAHVRSLGPGDGFGEIALLRDIPRTATVVAGEDVVLLALERERFLAAVTGLNRSERSATTVSDERLATRPTPEAWREAMARALDAGELLEALDLAEHGLAELPHDRALQSGAVLALARAGATDEARRRAAHFGLEDGVGAPDEPVAGPPGEEAINGRRAQLRGMVSGYAGLPADAVQAALLEVLAATRGDDVVDHGVAGDDLFATYADPARAVERAFALMDAATGLRERWPTLVLRLVVDAEPGRGAAGVPPGVVYVTTPIAATLAPAVPCAGVGMGLFRPSG